MEASAKVMGDELHVYLSEITKTDRFLSKQVNHRKSKQQDTKLPYTAPQPGQEVYIRNFVRKWREAKFEGTYRVVLSTPTPLKVEGKNAWIHLSNVRLKASVT